MSETGMALTDNGACSERLRPACRLRFRQSLNAPITEAWPVVSDFGSLLSWVSGGDKGWLQVSGHGSGSVRDFELPVVGRVQHRLELLDEPNHRLMYSLTRGRPLGMLRYQVSIRLFERGQNCEIEWVGEFDPVNPAYAPDLVEQLRDAYADMSERLSAYLDQQRNENG